MRAGSAREIKTRAAERFSARSQKLAAKILDTHQGVWDNGGMKNHLNKTEQVIYARQDRETQAVMLALKKLFGGQVTFVPEQKTSRRVRRSCAPARR